MIGLNRQQLELQGQARHLAQTVVAKRAAEIDRTEAYPYDVVNSMREAGFLGMTIPEEFGGRGLSFVDAVIVIEQIAQACGSSARIVVETNMGALSAVMAYGSNDQKRRMATCVRGGDKPAICITEPAAGSAATEMITRANKIGSRYVINGRKHWITGGGVSKAHLIFARVFENGIERGIGGFLAFRGEDRGLSVGQREPAMGLRGIPETELIFEDMEIDESMAVFAPSQLEKGFARLMTAYNSQRVGAAAVAIGIAQGAYEQALTFVKNREQFGRPLAEFQGLQWMLADMSIGIAAAQALIYKAAASADGRSKRFPDMTEAAQAKVLAAETAVRVTNDALQLHGAAGYSRKNPLERMVRDARMFTIGGGTAQVLRNQVAGAILGMKLPQTRSGFVSMEPSDGTHAFA